MADRERLTKAERRERARRERREKEEAEAKAQQRRRIMTVLITIAAIAGIFSLFWFTREPPAEGDITIARAAAEEAFQAAGCQEVTATTGGNAEHLSEPAPPPEQLYQQFPTASGPHFPATAPIGAFDDPLDERLTTHNLEHGSIVAWYASGYAQADEVRAWAEERNRAGFDRGSGAGIIAAPYERGLPPGKNVALRGWGVAVDCEEFDRTVADAFVIDNFGTHGQAPEAAFGEYPEDVLSYAGEDGATEPAPTTTDEPMELDSPSPTDGGTEAASPEPSPS